LSKAVSMAKPTPVTIPTEPIGSIPRPVASALGLMYPAERIPDYSREQFTDDLLSEHETDVRRRC
jgi:hypothetical protein